MKLLYKVLYIIFVLLLSVAVYAQQTDVTGKFINSKDNSSLVGVGIMLVNKVDTTKVVQTSTDTKGRFYFKNISFGVYKMKAFYVGFNKFENVVFINGSKSDVGVFKMEEVATRLKTVVKEEKIIKSELKNDTTELNANAFKVNKDASSQDLVTKMPGITTEGGVVKAQGENIQKVLIDGKEYFGDDAAIALKNIPAEVVDKIQIFDRMSDQSYFTGFDDGNTQKTMNIVTRNGRGAGTFGKAYGGYGTDDRYNAGGNLNYFKGSRRISVIGLANNINQQNFSSQDLLGVTGSQGGGGGRGGMGGFFGGGGGGGGGNNNFVVGSQSGINVTNSVGLNYIDAWGKKATIQASYFFNEVQNNTENNLTRNYFGKLANEQYNQSSISSFRNLNHRINARFEYNFDTSNSLIITPKFSFQDYRSSSTLLGATDSMQTLLSRLPLNKTSDTSSTKGSGYSFSNNILLRHKFAKFGRTISWNIGTDVNVKSGTNDLYTQNNFYKSIGTILNDSVSPFDQRTPTSSNGYNYSTSINFTEPVGKMGQLMFNYTPSYAVNNSEKITNSKDTTSGEFTNFNNTLSSKYISDVNTQRGGLSYRMRTENSMFMFGLNYQWVGLGGTITYPVDSNPNLSRTYINYLPGAMFMHKFSKNSNLRMFYRTSTNAPSISQLQTVIDNSNPLLLSTGNPNLIQSYSHNVITRFSLSNPDKGRTFFIMLSGNYTSAFIGNSTSTIGNGKQISMPVNLDGYMNANSYVTYGFGLKKLKSNLNLNLGVTYNRTPGQINNLMNYSNTYGINSGFVMGSNISERVDFTITYSGYFNKIENTIQSGTANNYFYHTATAKFNLMPFTGSLLKGLVLSSDVTNMYYNGLGSSYNINYYLWNGGVGYKFLKSQNAEIRFLTFDILNQNNSISRNITGTYIEDSRTKVLNRYYMLMFTYNIRNFGVSAPSGQRMRNQEK